MAGRIKARVELRLVGVDMFLDADEARDVAEVLDGVAMSTSRPAYSVLTRLNEELAAHADEEPT